MISRSTFLALVFASLATLSVAGVAKLQGVHRDTTAAPEMMSVYEMPRVVVHGKVQISHDQPAPGK